MDPTQRIEKYRDSLLSQMKWGENTFKIQLRELESKIKQNTTTSNQGDIENRKEKERIKTINECLDRIKSFRESLKSATTFGCVFILNKEYVEMMRADFHKMVYDGMDEEAIEKMTQAEKDEKLQKFLELDDQN